ncbi:MAG: trypsin-like peptidase domain-containing protein [Lachnospiraceae bacterium]|nr:trypsin-like peptidase domain-containing protein [Lachnospiraceae bacterium]
MKKLNWNRLLRMVLVLTLCIAALGAAAPRTAVADNGKVTTAREAADGVVLVASESESTLSYGTGFAIGKPGEPVRWIVTNYHVVDNAAEENGNIVVYFSAAANNYMVAELYWYSAEKDIAVLRLPEETTMRTALVLCPMRDVDMDDTFTALGYPSIAIEGNDYVKFDKDDIVVTRGVISKSTRVGSQDVYLIDIAISSGNSGGPLVNSKGEVVGINTFRYSDSEDQANYALAIDELIYSVNRNVIPMTLSTELEAEASNMMVIIICAVVIVVVIAVILIVVLSGKKKKSPTAPKMSKATGQAEFVLIGMGGAMNKREIVIPATGLTIGRDSSRCTLVYSMGEPGISGLHCTVTVSGGMVLVKDEGSSYGTFYNNQKLAPGAVQPVQNGERFYLAEPKNTFLVTMRNK